VREPEDCVWFPQRELGNRIGETALDVDGVESFEVSDGVDLLQTMEIHVFQHDMLREQQKFKKHLRFNESFAMIWLKTTFCNKQCNCFFFS